MSKPRPERGTALFWWPDGVMRDFHLYKCVGQVPKTLHDMGYNVIVVVNKLDTGGRQPWDKTYELGEQSWRGPRLMFRTLHQIVRMNVFLLKLLLKERPNIIIIVWSDPRILPALAIYRYFIMKNRDIKIVNKLDSDGGFVHSIYGTIYNQLGVLLSDKVAIETTCAYERVLSSRLLKLMASKLIVVPHGVADDILSSKINKKREKIILFAGENSYRKGLDVLIRALFRIKSELNGWKVVITSKLANDEYQNLIKKYIKLYGLEDKIEFIDADRAKLLDLYSSSSIFVLPTRWESYGIAIAEALASGLIVITTDGTCRRDFENLGAIVVKKDDVQELANALKYAIKNYERLLVARNSTLGEALLEKIRARHDYRYLVSLLIK